MDIAHDESPSDSDSGSDKFSDASWPVSFYKSIPIPRKPAIFPGSFPDMPIDATKEIRVLQLREGHGDDEIYCELAKITLIGSGLDLDLAMEYPYVALSYVWGTRDNPKSIRFIGCDQPFEVTHNLWSALRRLRPVLGFRWLWSDQLCIDQSLLVERNHQVQLMGRIYHQASRVIVWLGDVPTRLDDYSYYGWHGAIPDPDLLLALTEVLENAAGKWWERVWVIQEVANARKDPLLMVGPFEISWSRLMAFGTGTSSNLVKRFVETAASFRALSTTKGHFASMAEIIGRTKSSVPHDKVYALLDLIDPHQKAMISPDYSRKITEVLCETTAAALQYTQSFEMLAYVRLGAIHPHDLPSWSSDFEYTSPELWFSTYSEWGKMAQRTETAWTRKTSEHFAVPVCDSHLLKVEGLRFDTLVARLCDEPGRTHNNLCSHEQVGIPEVDNSYFSKLMFMDVSDRLNPYRRLYRDTNDGSVLRSTVLTDVDAARRRTWCGTDWATRRLFTSWIWPLKKGKFKPWQNPEPLPKQWSEYLRFISLRQQIFVTKTDFLVLGAHTARTGDVVVLPHSCPTPMLLRPFGDGMWKFQGFAYVNGIMDGELQEYCPDLELPREKFVLS